MVDLGIFWNELHRGIVLGEKWQGGGRGSVQKDFDGIDSINLIWHGLSKLRVKVSRLCVPDEEC